MQIHKKAKLYIISALVVGLIAGYLLAMLTLSPTPQTKQPAAQGAQSEQQPQRWTCSMHPQIKKPEPGKCPICGMDLIPLVEESDSNLAPGQIEFSEAAVKLMEIQTTPVKRRFVQAEIRMVGKIDYDETRVKHIAAWVAGRIDRMYVDFTGTTVDKGQHMVYLYSPELLSTQEELLQALKATRDVKKESSGLLKRTTRATLEAAREKLRLLGLKAEQIKKIEKTGKPTDHLTIYAPIGGIVIEKNAAEGMYVDTGTRLYTIADLSKMWVMLDAYESDLEWVRYGQQVEFTTQAYPGETFQGRISFIDPRVNPKTRTVKLRVNVDNPDMKLKPEMFVRAVVEPKVAGAGRVMDPRMAGKWICPMHPAVVKEDPGSCDICGMDLVTTASLGYRKIEPEEPPLIIPASAPLITGKRAVVYVKVPEAEKPTFRGREVTLGPRAGDYYIVEAGLAESEIVVTNGSFKIDSALQIQAEPSMMNPENEHRSEEQTGNGHKKSH